MTQVEKYCNLIWLKQSFCKSSVKQWERQLSQLSPPKLTWLVFATLEQHISFQWMYDSVTVKHIRTTTHKQPSVSKSKVLRDKDNFFLAGPQRASPINVKVCYWVSEWVREWVSEWWSYTIGQSSVGVSSLAVTLSKWLGGNVCHVP